VTSDRAAAPAPSVRIRVPATSANLGPGFDSFGLALALYDEVEVATTAGGLSVEATGPETVATDESNLVVRAIRAGFDAAGQPPPGLALRCTNRIPHARGLGSSAAAIVAGVAAANALAGGGLGTDDLLRVAAAIEGHPDNVAAALLGGFTVAWEDGAVPRALRVDPFPDLRPVAFVPTVRQATAASRATLPDRVDHADAAANAGRAALLALAMSGGEPAGGGVPARTRALFAATEDRLHQPYRLRAAPATGDLVARLRAAGVPAVLSGSGPSVLALAVGGGQAAAAVRVATAGFSVVPLAVDLSGVRVTPSGK
jgi:homoserine kinase